MGVEVSDEKKLFLRLPTRIKDELEIRKLHPDITQVYLPRQKTRRWCIVEFENKEKRQEAIVALKKVKINNKSIKVGLFKRKTYEKGGNADKSLAKTTKPLLKLLKKST